MGVCGGKEGDSLRQRGRFPLGGNTLRHSSLWERRFLRRRRRRLEENKGFNPHRVHFFSSFLTLLYFYGCISPLHELISFSRVFDVV